MIREGLLGKENPDYATSCMNLAEFYYASNEYEKAEKFFLEAERIYKKRMGTGYSDYGITCNSLGRLYWNLNQIPQAYGFYKEFFHSQSEQVRKTFQFTSEPEKISFLKNTTMLWNGISTSFISYNHILTHQQWICF